ncbi:hypothetical protein [Kutzneria buriramensis]|uniref:hypothetical protein n=1 Tax=Kutzneria buriramensis TaxID=1045776 RepID=UPI0011C1A0CD|nr:hypothetical protein [Kutzneria buriramensis]
MSAVIAAGMALGAAVAPASPAPAALGCRPDSVHNPWFTLSVKRALLSCDVVEVGVSGGGAIPPGGADLSVWGPDNFQHLTHAEAGMYKTVWRGDHVPGAQWCASFVGDAGEICLTS